MARYLGIDLGASNMRAAVTDGNARTLARATRATPQGPDGSAVEAALRELVVDATTEAGIEPAAIEAAAVVSFGPLDLAAGTVDEPANLPAIDRIRLRGPLATLLGDAPVYVHNDATAGVIGERFFTDPIPDDVVYLTISSGIGAGVAVDGTVLGGWDGNAGEVGHFVVDPTGRRTCGCGRPGHWEAYCSGENIPAYARDLHTTEAVETDLPLADPGFTAADVFAAAGEDPLADLVIDRIAEWNAIGVTNVVHAYAPLVVALGGAVATRNPALVVEPIEERIEDLVFTGVPEVRLASLGEDAVIRGAVASAITGGTGER